MRVDGLARAMETSLPLTMPAVLSGLVLVTAAGALLWFGADLFVDRADAGGRRLGVSALAVGLLLAGAEPEELITALIATFRDRGGIAAWDASAPTSPCSRLVPQPARLCPIVNLARRRGFGHAVEMRVGVLSSRPTATMSRVGCELATMCLQRCLRTFPRAR